MSLYLTLELCSIIIPLALSFDKKVHFYKYWRILFPSLILTGIFFISADILFTAYGIWGFNPQHTSGVFIAGLPLEEWLFFFVIPYSSIFIHFVLFSYFPDLMLPSGITRIITIILLAVMTLLILTNYDKTYTLFFSSVTIVLLLISMLYKNLILNKFYISFLIILIPFFVVNSILTGSFLQEEVVWYNAGEITGVRIFTIPVEDISFGFSLILMNLMMMRYFQNLRGKENFITI